LTNTPTPVTQSSSKPQPHTKTRENSVRSIKKKDARVHSALDNHTRTPPTPTPNREHGSMDAREDQSSSQDPTVRQRLFLYALFHFKPSKQPDQLLRAGRVLSPEQPAGRPPHGDPSPDQLR
jgi:hypothetical protein